MLELSHLSLEPNINRAGGLLLTVKVKVSDAKSACDGGWKKSTVTGFFFLKKEEEP